MHIMEKQKRTWVEVDLNAIEENLKLVKHPICCVVKGNAYGHGLVQVSKLFEKNNVKYLAVATIEEGIKLRKSGIRLPILILGYTSPQCAKELHDYNLTQTVYSLEYASELHKNCAKNKYIIKIHIKIDTGMGRLGFQCKSEKNELEEAIKVVKMSSFIVEGLFMHFSISEDNKDKYNQFQKDNFDYAINFFKENNVNFDIIHCANSAAIINFPNYYYDMVRAGIILYGYNPTNTKLYSLKRALKLYSIVTNVKMIHKGDYVSYDKTYCADENTYIATISIGYADGYFRSNQGNFVYIKGKRYPIVGRICMDQMMIKCDDSIELGDIVEIYGDNITIEDVAKYNNTIPYEILCAIGERVPRVYRYNGKIIDIDDKLDE